MSNFKTVLRNLYDKSYIKRAKYYEKVKFKNPRRKDIWQSIILTKQQEKQIDDIFVTNYGKKIPYTWHRHFTAYTGNFDPCYFPELLYIPEFEHFMNIDKEYCKVFADKNVLPILAKQASVKMPKEILSSIDGIYRDKNYNEVPREELKKHLFNIGEAFAKPSVDTNSGKGCKLINIRNGMDEYSGQDVCKVIEDLGDNFVIQEKLKCHKDIANIYPKSVNTFRIITYRWKDGYHYMPVIMRIGRGGQYLDNAHAGGIFIGIDDDGSLKKSAFTEFHEEYLRHPDTGIVFEGYKINCFEKVITAAMKMCMMIPQVGSVNWDFTIDEEGEPVLIEANMNGGSVWLIEMAHGCGAFGELTPDILKWLKKMESTPYMDYCKYRFGR